MKNLSAQDVDLSGLENLINHAWHNALKYRFDPFMGRIHEEYLQMLKELKKEIKEKVEK